MRSTRPILLVLALLLLAPATASAKGDDDVERTGTCSGASSAEIKLSQEDGRIETEFEVDQNRNGVRWTVVLKRNGKRVTKTTATTRGPSGSFELRRLLRDGDGAERVKAKATSPTGEVCTARATFR